MALSATKIDESVFGNKRVQMYSCVADAATGSFDTSLSFVDIVSTAFKSMTTGGAKFAINKGVSGTAIVGTVAVTGMTSGDEFYITVYGR